MRRLTWDALDQQFRRSPWWTRLRAAALYRDGYRCQGDGEHAGKLGVHHLKPLRHGGQDELANLVTLCRKHHEQAEARIDALLIELPGMEGEAWRIERVASTAGLRPDEWVKRTLLKAIEAEWPGETKLLPADPQALADFEFMSRAVA